MNIRPILSHELVVGDYLGVIASMHQPEHFRRVEKLEYIDADLGQHHLKHDVFYLEAANMGPVIAWCHGIAGPLILPAGDVHIWLDVPWPTQSWRSPRSTAQSSVRIRCMSWGSAALYEMKGQYRRNCDCENVAHIAIQTASRVTIPEASASRSRVPYLCGDSRSTGIG
jgi:hypothetical protein